MIPKRRGYRPAEKVNPHRINEEIDAPEVRLVGDDAEPVILNIEKALHLAEEKGLDLVEISPNAKPPVCKILDYKKFLYERKKKEKEIKANAHKTEIKEIRFSPNTDEHDLEFKRNHAIKFLSEGAKVKIYVHFRGRAIVFKERGELLLLQFAKSLEEYGALEGMPNLEGKRMIAFIAPKKKK
ncbi:MAG: translation initiation factor IF-3 [Chitinophagales bacterium]|nr:translation initiation factor IF-3 [Chitinophagales bacterium]